MKFICPVFDMDLSIVIVSYNTKEILRDCLNSIYETVKNINFEVIVVDNASTDGTGEAISDFMLKTSSLKLIENNKNLGFSKANNIGVNKSSGKYVLFLNPDTILHKDTINKMLSFMDQNPRCGASTCKVLLQSGKIDDSCHRGFPTPWNSLTHFSGLSKLLPRSKIFNGYNLGNLDLAKTHEIEALAGSFMFTRRTAGEDVNWWDEDYFFYGEDLDFCFMLKQKGWIIFYNPQVTITHLKGVSGGIKKISKEITTADDKTKNLATKWRFDAMRIFYKKHYAESYPWFITQLVYLGIALKQKSVSIK
jgi:GT2 family glycosyltransferase